MLHFLAILFPIVYLLLGLACLRLMPLCQPVEVSGVRYDLRLAWGLLVVATVLHPLSAAWIYSSGFTGELLSRGLITYALAEGCLLLSSVLLLWGEVPLGTGSTSTSQGPALVAGMCALLLLVPGCLLALYFLLIKDLKFNGI